LSTAETWVVGGREAEAVGSARCGASRDEGDLAEEVGSFCEIVSIGSGIERKPYSRRRNRSRLRWSVSRLAPR